MYRRMIEKVEIYRDFAELVIVHIIYNYYPLIGLLQELA